MNIGEELKRLDELINYLANTTHLAFQDAELLRNAYPGLRDEIERLRKVDQLLKECLDAIRTADFQLAERLLVVALAGKPKETHDPWFDEKGKQHQSPG